MLISQCSYIMQLYNYGMVDNDEVEDIMDSKTMDKAMTDEQDPNLPNGIMAHLDYPNEAVNHNTHCDAYKSSKTVGFFNHTVSDFSFIGPD